MVNNHNNLPPIEEIREVKNEIPSFEEFMQSYKVDEEIIDSYNFEVDSYKGISVGKISGPMPFNDALMIAGSQTILNKIRRDFPKTAELLEWNPEATLGFLKEKNALSLYQGTDAFRVPCSHRDDYSKTGPEAWQEYRRKIKEYVDNISSKGKAAQHHEELAAAREVLVGYIHEEYYKVLPRWPDVGKTNTRSFEAKISGSYDYGATSQVVWSCMGWIEVTDERPATDIFKASFKGSPEIKLLILNLHQLKTIEDMCVSRGIEDAKNHIRNKQPAYQLTWDDL